MSDLSMVLNAYGLNPSGVNFSLANIMAWLIFSIIGLCAFNYGRKNKNYRTLIIGLVLMVYPYFVSSTLWLYILGIGFSSLLYFWKD